MLSSIISPTRTSYKYAVLLMRRVCVSPTPTSVLMWGYATTRILMRRPVLRGVCRLYQEKLAGSAGVRSVAVCYGGSGTSPLCSYAIYAMLLRSSMLCSYALATPCPVLTLRILLPEHFGRLAQYETGKLSPSIRYPSTAHPIAPYAISVAQIQ
eukprot:3804297-Rhodomonas_salina.2